MEVILAATKTCHHCPMLEKELQRLHVSYTLHYYEEHPELIEKYKLKKSPILIVDGKVVFTGMPSIYDLERYFR